MKKLRKLTLNEMQDYAPLSTHEQISMKGGNAYSYYRIVTVAWEVSKTLAEFFWGSGSTSKDSSSPCPPDSIEIHGIDSVMVGDIKVYGSNVMCIPNK